MKFKNIIIFSAMAAISAACTNPVETYDAIFMTDAQKNAYKTITIDTPPDGTTFTVSSSVKAEEDVQIELEVRPDLLEDFNKKNGKNYVMAPDGCFELSSYSTSIRKGYTQSSEVALTVNSMSDFAEGTTYCIPVGIKSASKMQVLEPSRTLFIVLKTPVISKAIYLGSSPYSVPSFKEDASLSAIPTLTLEARVYVEQFQSRSPFISSVMGIEGECLMRFGDVKVDNNCIQICQGSYQPAAMDKPCDTNTWYHVAAVWTGKSLDIYIDGQYVTGVPTNGEPVNLTADNGFYLGRSYGGRYLSGYVAEMRVWTKALSQAEIANNMNYVDPHSDGLLAYWRMNRYEGTTVPDETGHGYDAVGGSSNPKMIDTKWL